MICLKILPFCHIICLTESVHFNVSAPPHNKNWKQQWLKAARFLQNKFYVLFKSCWSKTWLLWKNDLVYATPLILFANSPEKSPFNPSRPNPGRREKIKLDFYFHFFAMPQKGFMKAFQALIKAFEAPQRSVKIKI